MTPGSVVLLHAPGESTASWGDLPRALRSAGADVIAPDVPGDAGARYVARASLIIAAAGPAGPLALVARGAAGPLVPAVALAQRAARRSVAGFVFVDADLPRPARGHDHDAPGAAVPVPPDWPDAPCAYLRTHAGRAVPPAGDGAVREARLRGWHVLDQDPATTVAQALKDLLAAL